MKMFFRAAVLCAVLGFSGAAFAHAPNKNFNTVRDAQIRLDGLGYHTGAYDGVMGPRTKNAIRNCQRDNDLLVSGKLTHDTYSVLRHYSSALTHDGHYYYPNAYYNRYNVVYYAPAPNYGYHIPAYNSYR